MKNQRRRYFGNFIIWIEPNQLIELQKLPREYIGHREKKSQDRGRQDGISPSILPTPRERRITGDQPSEGAPTLDSKLYITMTREVTKPVEGEILISMFSFILPTSIQERNTHTITIETPDKRTHLDFPDLYGTIKLHFTQRTTYAKAVGSGQPGSLITYQPPPISLRLSTEIAAWNNNYRSQPGVYECRFIRARDLSTPKKASRCWRNILPRDPYHDTNLTQRTKARTVHSEDYLMESAPRKKVIGESGNRHTWIVNRVLHLQQWRSGCSSHNQDANNWRKGKRVGVPPPCKPNHC